MQVGETLDAPTNAEVQLLYGKWEDWVNATLPSLDACGGHYGATPDSNGAEVYHYHVQVVPRCLHSPMPAERFGRSMHRSSSAAFTLRGARLLEQFNGTLK